jgi:hypothetical protein
MIALEIGSGADTVAALRSFPDRLSARLFGVMQTLGIALQDTVRDNLGGKVLRKRSGRLAAGVDVAVTSAGNDVGVAVGIAGVPYAAYQEYGWHGTETVRAHLRTIKEAFGRPIAPRAVTVRSFARRVDYPAHSYLRSALAAVAPEALAQIDAAAAEEAAL